MYRESFGKIIEDTVGTFLRHVDENDPSAGLQGFISFYEYTGEAVDVARSAVEKYGVIVTAAEIGLFGSRI